MSNKQIVARLVVSERTAEFHILNLPAGGRVFCLFEARGIGKATAIGLATLGARVGITGRDQARTPP